ncbi:MAG: T9SS type A sorting domain-containing protein, partial [Bacteroidota bacterium]
MSGYVFPDDTSNTEDGWLIRTDSMGCLIPNCFTEVEELLNIDVGLLIYPNPNDGKFVVEIENIEAAVVGGRRQEEMRVLILDIFGRVVYEKIVNSNSQKFEIDISENASGIYFVNICSNAYSKTIKLVKE